MRDLQEDLEKIRKTNGYHAEMWPYMLCEHAIERAIKAEAEVERLQNRLSKIDRGERISLWGRPTRTRKIWPM